MIRWRRTVAVLALAGLAVLALMQPMAHAAVYPVRACMSSGDTRNASWYGVGGSPGTVVYAVCPAGEFHPYDTGLGARTNGNASSRVGLNGGSWAQFDAPPGTSLHSVWFNGALGGQTEGGCWESGISAWSGDFYSASLAWGLQPCFVTSGGWLANQVVSLGYAAHARVGVRCASWSGCQADWAGGHGVWANLRDVTVMVEDDQPPSVAPTRGSLLSPVWHRGAGDAWAYYADNAGVRRIALQVDGTTYQSQDFGDPSWAAFGVACDDARPVPCHNLEGGLAVNTRGLSDGHHTLRLAGADSAGNWGVADRELLVDNHAPDAPRGAAVVGGEGWHRANGFDVAWSNPAEGDAAPITEGRYRLCRASAPDDCREGAQTGEGITGLRGITVPDQGDWVLRAWLVDAAGNVDAGRMSAPLHLRFDPQVDGAAFAPLDRGDPRRLVVHVTDYASGVAPGSIQLRRRGTDAWRALTTATIGADMTALVPDTELADGTYELRAVARDVAGNELVIGRYADGSAAVIVLPLRTPTRLVGEARGAARRTCRTVTRTVRRGRRRVRVRRRVCRTTTTRADLGGSLAVPFGGGVRIRGALQTSAGRPVIGAAVAVSATPRTGGAARAVATVRTGADGGFSYSAPAGPSRTLRFAFPGDELLLPVRADVALRVPAGATLNASRRSVRNGSSVDFTGRLLARPAFTGKLVVVQAFYRGAWRTFAVTRADARGRYRQSYRFQATLGRVAYRFRVLLPREPAYPYESGVTRVVTVVVHGG